VAALTDELRAQGRRVVDTPTDVTQAAQVNALIRATLQTLGKIDVLVNVAGTVSFGGAATLPEPEWERVLAVNLKGTFLCCQAAIAPMRAQKYGRIINIGSILGKNGGNARPWLDAGEQAQASNVAYGVSKAGVHAMTMFLARELADAGITVNAVAPGPIASNMTASFPQRLRDLIPVGRMGTADEVARACLFLAGESSGYITAEILDVNGGMWGD
jgi:3-oxoacyl-[acyl-carrier protein] reductase